MKYCFVKNVLQTQRINHYSYFCRNEKKQSGALAVTARLDSYNAKCLGENCHFSYSTGCEDKRHSYFFEPAVWDRGCCSGRVLVAHSSFAGLGGPRLLAEESGGLWQEAPRRACSLWPMRLRESLGAGTGQLRGTSGSLRVLFRQLVGRLTV